MNTTTKQDFWQMLENPPEYASEVTALWSWSLNFDAGQTPATVFLDLIGYSEEEYGTNLYNYSKMALGYMELDYLADALKEYASRPLDVRQWVEQLLEAEANN